MRFVPICGFLLLIGMLLALPGGLVHMPYRQAWASPEHATAAREPTNGGVHVYFPLIVMPPRVSPLQFATAIDEQNRPIDPSTTFPAGTDQIYVTTVIEGAANLDYRIEWVFPPETTPARLVDGDAISTAVLRFAYRVCRVSQETGACSGAPLPTGTYEVRLFLEDTLYRQATATIQ